jgi:hypothetical protein
MLSMYGRVFSLAARRAVRAWPAALSLLVYAVILTAAGYVLSPLPPLIAGLVMGLVLAACWSSYLELISQAVRGSKIRVKWDDFKQSFGARFWDVISVMFAFMIISFVLGIVARGPNADAIMAIVGIAFAFFFNVVPELLYQGQSRSFALLVDSGNFMLANPVAWMLPNLVFVALVLAPAGALQVEHPGDLLVLFGKVFTSPGPIVGAVFTLPEWTWPVFLLGIHYVMIFRGILFMELSSGGGRARAFAAR